MSEVGGGFRWGRFELDLGGGIAGSSLTWYENDVSYVAITFGILLGPARQL